MKKTFLLIAIAALSIFCSCNKELDYVSKNTRMIPLQITAGAETDNDISKAWYKGADKRFMWAASDELSSFDGVVTVAGGNKFTTTADANGQPSGIFSGEVSEGATGAIHFLYPYQTYIASVGTTNYTTNFSENKIFPVEAPYNYATQATWMPPKSLMMTGKLSSKESTDPVTMKTPLGFIKFTVVASEQHPLTKIEIRSQNTDPLAGTYTLDVSGDDPVVVFQETPYFNSKKQKVSYDIFLTPRGAASFASGTYYVALPPKTYNLGIGFKFTDDIGMVSEKVGSASLTINRAQIKDLGTINMSSLDWYDAIDLRFFNAVRDKPAWPFNEPSTTIKNVVHTFTFGEDNDEFKILGVNEIGWYELSGLNIKGTNSYVEIPGRIGKKIHKVFLRAGGMDSNLGNPVFVDATGPNADGKYNTLTKSNTFEWLNDVEPDNSLKNAWWGPKKFGWSKQWIDFPQEEGQAFRIRLTNGGDGMKIINLMVLYKDAE